MGIQYFNRGGYAGIHHSKYWMPNHYDTIEDGQNKKSHLLFSNYIILNLCLYQHKVKGFYIPDIHMDEHRRLPLASWSNTFSHVQTVVYLRLLEIYEGIIIILYRRSLSTREKNNLRRLVICWKTRRQLLSNGHVKGVVCATALIGKTRKCSGSC